MSLVDIAYHTKHMAELMERQIKLLIQIDTNVRENVRERLGSPQTYGPDNDSNGKGCPDKETLEMIQECDQASEQSLPSSPSSVYEGSSPIAVTLNGIIREIWQQARANGLSITKDGLVGDFHSYPGESTLTAKEREQHERKWNHEISELLTERTAIAAAASNRLSTHTRNQAIHFALDFMSTQPRSSILDQGDWHRVIISFLHGYPHFDGLTDSAILRIVEKETRTDINKLYRAWERGLR